MAASTDRNYSHRTLADKLGLARGQRTAVINISNDDFITLLRAHLGQAPQTALRGTFDRIYLQIDAETDLKRIAPACKHLAGDGALWIFHPKGRGAAVSDAQVREVYLRCGVVDNKISAYTDTHTATRCVVRLTLRRSRPS